MEGFSEADLQALFDLASRLAPLLERQQAEGGDTGLTLLALGGLLNLIAGAAFLLYRRYAQRIALPMQEAVTTLHGIQQAQRLQSLVSAQLLEVALSLDLPALGVEDDVRERLRRTLGQLVDQLTRAPSTGPTPAGAGADMALGRFA